MSEVLRRTLEMWEEEKRRQAEQRTRTVSLLPTVYDRLEAEKSLLDQHRANLQYLASKDIPASRGIANLPGPIQWLLDIARPPGMREAAEAVANRVLEAQRFDPRVSQAMAAATRALTEGFVPQTIGGALRGQFGEQGEQMAQYFGLALPEPGTVPDIAGQLAGALGGVALAGGLARGAIGAAGRIPQVAQLFQRAPILQSAATGATQGGLIAMQKAARGEEVTPRDWAEYIAFFGGIGASSPFISQALVRTLPPNVARYAFGPLREAGETLVGGLAAAPFTDAETPGQFFSELGLEILADALLGSLMWAVDRQSRQYIVDAAQQYRNAANAAREFRRQALRQFGLDDQSIRNYDEAVEQIKRSYREQARELHPDRGGDPVQFQALVRARDEALQILESRRASIPQQIYDNARRILDTLFGRVDAPSAPVAGPTRAAAAAEQSAQQAGPPALLPAPRTETEVQPAAAPGIQTEPPRPTAEHTPPATPQPTPDLQRAPEAISARANPNLTAGDIPSLYMEAQVSTAEGSWDRGAARNYATQILQPIAQRLEQAEWLPTNDLSQAVRVTNVKEARRIANDAINQLVHLGYAQIAWDADGNPYVAKVGRPIPAHLTQYIDPETNEPVFLESAPSEASSTVPAEPPTPTPEPQPEPTRTPQPEPTPPVQQVSVGDTVYWRGEPLTVVDASDRAMLTVRNQLGTEFRIGRNAVSLTPQEGEAPTAPPQTAQEAPRASEVAGPASEVAQEPSPVVEPEIASGEGRITPREESADTTPGEAVQGTRPQFKPEDIDYQLAVRAFQWTSFTPEDRARAVQEDYVRHMEELYNQLETLAQTPEQRAILNEEIERYRRTYVVKTSEWLRLHSQMASPMITGPAKFPVERQRKLNERERRLLEDFRQWQERAQKAIRRRLLDARTGEQVADDEFERLKAEVERTASILREIDEGNEPGDRRSFVNSLAGKIRRSADAGNLEAAERALDYVRQVQANMKKPIFTERHSIWNAIEQARARRQEAAARPGTEIVAEFEGVQIVRNNQLERVQIVFSDKPPEEVRQELNKTGWRWSPSNQAWQRKLTNAAEWDARRIIERYYGPATPEAEPTPVEPEIASGEIVVAEASQPDKPESPHISVPQAAFEVSQRDRELFEMGYSHGRTDFRPSDLNVLNEPAYRIGLQRAREEEQEVGDHFRQLYETFGSMHGTDLQGLRRSILAEFQGQGSLPPMVHKVDGKRQAQRVADQTGHAVLYVDIHDDQHIPIHGRIGRGGPLYAIELPWRFDTEEREISVPPSYGKWMMLSQFIGDKIRGVDDRKRPDDPRILMPRRWAEDTVPYPKLPFIGPNTDEYLPPRLQEWRARYGQPSQPQQEAPPTPAEAPAPPAPEEAPAPPRVEATGSAATVYTARQTPVNVRYALVEADQLITSNDPHTLRVNPAFPQELQPRDRTRAASEDQIEHIAANLRPEFLGASPKASDGAPIVGPDGVVESGNARTIALIRAYDTGRAQRYKDWLAANAEEFGLSPETVRSMNRPILVRVREGDVDRRQFVVEANEQSVASMSATEQAVADAERITPGMMNLFMPSETGDILTPANRDFIRRFMEEIVGPAERGEYMTDDGQLSLAGVTRIRNAVFQKAYGDPETLSLIAESTDNNVRNVTNAMLIAAPRFADMRDRIAEGSLHNLDPSEDLTAAVRKLSSLRAEGQDVETYLRQVTMFEDDLSPLAKDFLVIFDRHKRSQKRLGAILRTYTEIVESLGDPKQELLFDDVRIPTKAEILQAAVEKVEAGYEPGTRQASLFGSEAIDGSVVEGETRQMAEGAEARRDEIRGLPAQTAEAEQVRAEIPHERIPERTVREKPETRKQVIDYIEKEFLMPVREGRVQVRRARGTFNLRTHVTRLRRAEDLYALGHEFGHFLSETQRLQPNLYPELEPLGAALYPEASPELQREEGAAEFFRIYFTQGSDAARQVAPMFFEAWEEHLESDPSLKGRIREAQRLFSKVYNLTGTAEVRAAIVREEPKDRPFLKPHERFYADWIESLQPTYKAMKLMYGPDKVKSEWDVPLKYNAYVLGRLAHGRWAIAHAMLTRSQYSPDFQEKYPSLKEILAPVANRIDDFEVYIVAKRGLELHERGINPGFSREGAEAAVAELEDETFRTALERLVRYQNVLIDHLVDSGMLDQATADSFRMMNRFYVPFYRYFGEEAVSGGMRGMRQKWGNLPQMVKTIRGSTRSIYSPLQSIIRNTITFIDVAERNRAARALADLADRAKGMGWLMERVRPDVQVNRVYLERLRKDLEEAGIPKEVLDEADLDRVALIFSPVRHARFKEAKENILTIYRNGEAQFYQVHPELYRALQFLDQPASNWLFRMLQLPTRLLRAGAILTPEFAIRNPIRDQFTAFANSKYGFRPVIDPVRALFHLVKGEKVGGDELYDLWQASGGAQSTMISLNREYLEADLRKLIGQKTRKEKALEIIRSPITALEFITEATELATRLAEFERGIEKGGKTPEAIRWAAYASREVSIDFQRAGRLGRHANQVKAFFNATLQGPDKMAREFRKDPVRYTIIGLVSVTLPSIVMYLINRDDPRYQELPRWRKDLYWSFFTEDSVLFVPKPFEFGVLFGTVPERVLEWIATNDPKAFKDFEDTLFSTFLPGDPRSPIDWLPDALLPLVEVSANRDVFTDRPIVPRAEQDLEPWAQYGPRTSELAKWAGRLFGISPRKLDHLIEGYTAGLGRHALQFIDLLAGADPLYPLFRPFSSDLFVSAASLDEFYEELAQLEAQQRTINEMQKRGEQPTGYVDTRRLSYLRRVRDQLSDLRRRNRQILESKTLTPEQKRQMSAAIQVQMVNLARAALGRKPVQAPTQSGTETSPSSESVLGLFDRGR